MTTACASARPTVAAQVWVEMVASLANMIESALTGAGGSGPEPAVIAAAVIEDVSCGVVAVVCDDPGRVEGERSASRPGGDRLYSPCDIDAGPRAHRVDDAPVRPGRAGGPAGVGGQRHRGDRRRSGSVRAQHHAPRRA